MSSLSQLLLQWYANFGRELPWRVKGGPHPDPYVVLVSEFMLQQTTVKTVIPYFKRFMERFPTIDTLARAEQEEVYLYWQGLGYYSRARSLHQTARLIVENYGGHFPRQRDEVLKLKGIGAYTASSLLALAFDQPETVIDGNVIRVICRLYHLTQPTAEIMPEIAAKAAALTDHEHPADYASAIMDLGALVCLPQNPQCLLCPWQSFCQSKSCPDLEQIPRRQKPLKKLRQGKVYLIRNRAGEVFIRKRTEKGLLSELYEFPWSDERDIFSEKDVKETKAEVSHTFTHFKLLLRICLLWRENVPLDGRFVAWESLSQYPFSTLMKKVCQKASALNS